MTTAAHLVGGWLLVSWDWAVDGVSEPEPQRPPACGIRTLDAAIDDP
jgi:hypothetical protein